MFVRWKTKKLKSKLVLHNSDILMNDHLNYVQLVRTSWETGKPRQKVIKYLGSIRESQLHKTGYQNTFWMKIREKLRELDLSLEDKNRIEAKIEEVVPKR